MRPPDQEDGSAELRQPVPQLGRVRIGQYRLLAMPTTVFIDATGTVVEVHGGETSAGALRDRIDELLLS